MLATCHHQRVQSPKDFPPSEFAHQFCPGQQVTVSGGLESGPRCHGLPDILSLAPPFNNGVNSSSTVCTLIGSSHF